MTKSIFGKFRKLEKKKKLQLVIAVSISVVLLVALPVYAWFTHKRSIALTTKINAPTQLYITAGNKESVANLEMADIDVENGSYKDFVFGIGGADVQQYQIQLAHTTNIPFEYEIYRAKSVSETEKSEAVVYVSDEENKTFYYKIDGNKISGHYLNQQGSEILANSTLHEKSYDSYGNVQKNAEALYWQSDTLTVIDNKDPFCDYFIMPGICPYTYQASSVCLHTTCPPHALPLPALFQVLTSSQVWMLHPTPLPQMICCPAVSGGCLSSPMKLKGFYQKAALSQGNGHTFFCLPQCLPDSNIPPSSKVLDCSLF